MLEKNVILTAVTRKQSSCQLLSVLRKKNINAYQMGKILTSERKNIFKLVTRF